MSYITGIYMSLCGTYVLKLMNNFKRTGATSFIVSVPARMASTVPLATQEIIGKRRY